MEQKATGFPLLVLRETISRLGILVLFPGDKQQRKWKPCLALDEFFAKAWGDGNTRIVNSKYRWVWASGAGEVQPM